MSGVLLLSEEPSETREETIATVSGPLGGRRDVVCVPAVLPLHRAGQITAYALVDEDAREVLEQHRWNLDSSGYAYTNISAGRVALHRFVMGLRQGEPLIVHHLNAEKLDCRRANLQIVTQAGHAIAHGMRPRAEIVTGREPSAEHPAVARGLRRWLEEHRAADPVPGASGDFAAMTRGARPKNLPKVLTADEVDALMRMPNLRCPTGLRDRALMGVMHRCGLRVSEACGLHLRDVKWSEKKIHLRPEITKGNREAVVYLDARTQDLLERWVEQRRKYAAGKPWLFVTLRGGQLDRHAVWEMVSRRARKAGIVTPVGPHTLRHTYATELLKEGFSIREVQQLLRHADIRTTVLYTHLFDADLAAKIANRD